jgi:DNA glycosylase AlkZ-like
MQAQKYEAAKWGLGLRMRDGAIDAQVERAFETGQLLRTHVMRPTWHFVAPADPVALGSHCATRAPHCIVLQPSTGTGCANIGSRHRCHRTGASRSASIADFPACAGRRRPGSGHVAQGSERACRVDSSDAAATVDGARAARARRRRRSISDLSRVPVGVVRVLIVSRVRLPVSSPIGSRSHGL